MPAGGFIIIDKTKLAKELLINPTGRLNLLNILSQKYPGIVFEKRYSNKHGYKVLLINGRYHGNYDVMDEDINSYYALDSLKMTIEMVGNYIKSKGL